MLFVQVQTGQSHKKDILIYNILVASCTQLICEMSGTFIDTKYKGYQKLLKYIFYKLFEKIYPKKSFENILHAIALSHQSTWR